MKWLIASVSALALAASPAIADAQGKGNGKGKDKDRGGHFERGDKPKNKGHKVKGHKAQGHKDKDRARFDKRDRKRDKAFAEARRDRREDRKEWREERREQRADARERAFERQQDRRERAFERAEARRDRYEDDDRRAYRVRYRDDDRDYRDRRDYREDRRYADRRDYRDRDRRDYRRVTYRIVDGCPPGLRKKRNGCLPPGQAKKRDRRVERYYSTRYAPDFWGVPYRENVRYRYDDGYLLRFDGGRVGGYIPLLGGALAIGNPWPTDYGRRAVPDYYVDYYDLGRNSSYRYADNVVYRLDSETAAITSIAALLTGDEFVVGQPMPRGYDVYNVPYSYRDRYYDRPDALYRYSDGYVYQIDPETRLIAAAIELLV